MTTDELRELLEVAERVPKSSIFDISMTVDRSTFAALARLALAARDAQAVEHAENCMIHLGVQHACNCGLRELDAALAAVFGGDDAE